MAAVRQGVWQKLTQAAAGKDQPGAQKAMQAINEFLNGSGSDNCTATLFAAGTGSDGSLPEGSKTNDYSEVCAD